MGMCEYFQVCEDKAVPMTIDFSPSTASVIVDAANFGASVSCLAAC